MLYISFKNVQHKDRNYFLIANYFFNLNLFLDVFLVIYNMFSCSLKENM